MKNKKVRIIILSILIVVALIGIIWGSYFLKNCINDLRSLKLGTSQFFGIFGIWINNPNTIKFILISTLCLYISAIGSVLVCAFALIFTIKPKFKKIKIVAFIVSIELLIVGLCMGAGVLNRNICSYKQETFLKEKAGENYEHMDKHELFKNNLMSTIALYTSNLILLIGSGIVLLIDKKSKE